MFFNPVPFFNLLSVTSIPDLKIGEDYSNNYILALEIESDDFNCYVTYDANEHSVAELVFVYIYNVYCGDGTGVKSVEVETFGIKGSLVLNENNVEFNLDDYSTEEALFQLSTIQDCCLTLKDIKEFKEQVDSVYEMLYNAYPEFEIRR